MNLAALRDLYQYMEWADASVWTAVFASTTAQNDTKLRDGLYHLHVVQRAFLRIWRGESPNTPFPSFAELQELMAWGRSYYADAFDHLATLSNERSLAPLPVPWAALVEQRLGRAPETATVGETALQVVLHTQYHRGQINSRLREVGGEPPLVDYITWVWLGRPKANWPAVTS